MKILLLCGSLRKASYNSIALHAIERLARPCDICRWGEISSLPLFNPDREEEGIASVVALKQAVAEAQALIIATPEYAHGISGPMKNALDWLVSGAEFPHMPIMLINTSPRAAHAQAALREVLKTMSGILIEEASVSIPLLSTQLSAEDIAQEPVMATELHRALSALRAAVVDLDEARE